MASTVSLLVSFAPPQESKKEDETMSPKKEREEPKWPKKRQEEGENPHMRCGQSSASLASFDIGAQVSDLRCP
jgi:hypothetical protein